MSRSLNLKEIRRRHIFRLAEKCVFAAMDHGDEKMLIRNMEALIRADSGLIAPSKQLREIGGEVEFYLHQSEMIAGDNVEQLIELSLIAQKPLSYFLSRYHEMLLIAIAIVCSIACLAVTFSSLPFYPFKLGVLAVTGLYGLFLWLPNEEGVDDRAIK